MFILSNISQQTKLVAVFFLIVIVHVVFKVFYLDYSCLWYDETFGLHYSLQDWGLIKHTSEWDLNPPLYYYFLYIWRNLFGVSEFAIRFSSVLFSSLAAGMLYLISVKYFNKTTALIALLIYTASNEMYFYAHEARCYALLFFLILFSTYHFFKLNKEKSISSIICLGIGNFLIVYTHYVAGLVLFFQVILMFAFYNKSFTKQAGIAYLITLVLVFWRFTRKMFLLIFHHEKSFWVTKPTFTDLQNTFYDFFNGKEYFLAYLLIALLALIIPFIVKKGSVLNKIHVNNTYVLLCGVGAILICFSVSLITPIFIKRYVLFAIPFMCIFIGYIVSKVSNIKLRNLLVLFVCVVSLGSFTKIDFHTDKKMNYRDAMVLLKQEKTAKTLVLVQTRDMEALFSYYYDKSIFTNYGNVVTELRKNNIYLIQGMDDVKNTDLNPYEKVILTQTFVQAGKENDKLLEFITSKYTKQNQIKDYEGINLYIFTNQ